MSRSLRSIAIVASAAVVVPLFISCALGVSACGGTYAPKEGAPPPRASDYRRDPVPGTATAIDASSTSTTARETANTSASANATTSSTSASGTASSVGSAASSSRGKNDRPKSISARHILIQYMGAKRADAKIVRTREQARAVAEEVLQKLKAGATFTRLVLDYSDEPNAGQRGGSLGRFKRGDMDKAFEEAAFALEPGQVSGIVESGFGFHIIERLE